MAEVTILLKFLGMSVCEWYNDDILDTERGDAVTEEEVSSMSLGLRVSGGDDLR